MPKTKRTCINPYNDESHKKARSSKGLTSVTDDVRNHGRIALPNFNWDNRDNAQYICGKCRMRLKGDALLPQRIRNAQNALRAYQQMRGAPIAEPAPGPEAAAVEPSAPPLAALSATGSSVIAPPLTESIEPQNTQVATETTTSIYPALPSSSEDRTQKRKISTNSDKSLSHSTSERSLTVTTPTTRPPPTDAGTASTSLTNPGGRRTADFNTTLQSLGLSPVTASDRKKRSVITRKFLQFQDFAISALGKFSRLKPRPESVKAKCEHCSNLLNELSGKYQEQNTRREKYKILTCIPKRFTVQKVRNSTGCTSYESKKAQQLKTHFGAFSWPEYNFGRPLSNDVKQLVLNYYLSDTNSRTSPNAREVVKVTGEDGTIALEAKRRLLHNLNELYNSFKEEHKDVKVGIAKFAELRPKHCVWPGQKRQHNVCVCEVHQNFTFILQALAYKTPVKDLVNGLVCGNNECFLGLCELCPFMDKVEDLFQNIAAEGEVTFTQWTHTDSIEIKRITLAKEDFQQMVRDYVPKFIAHDYIYRQQADYIKKIKSTYLKSLNAISIQVDFAQNYTCVAQNSTQSFYWTSRQITLHPFVVNWWEEDQKKVLYKSYCVISDDLRHDANSFHAFRTDVMRKILTDLQHLEIKKVFYISDGAGSQYKNYKNFANLMAHESEYGIEAEWVFTATSHGKSTCDAIGAVAKCATRRESLKEDVIIMDAKQMFDFCQKKFASKADTLEFLFCTRDDVELQKEGLLARYEEHNKLQGIRKHHVFIPQKEGQLRVLRSAGSGAFTDLQFKKVDIEHPHEFTGGTMIPGNFYAFVYDTTYHVGMYVSDNEIEGDGLFQPLKLNRNSGVSSWPSPTFYLDVPYRDVFMQVNDPTFNDGRYLVEDIKAIKANHRALKAARNASENPS